MNDKAVGTFGGASRSMRILIFSLMLQMSLACATGWCAQETEGRIPAETAVSATAEPGDSAADADGKAESAPPEQDATASDQDVKEPGAAIELSESAAAPSAPADDSAAAKGAIPAVTGSPVLPADREAVPWWRSFAHLVGVGPDPRPGETAQAAPGRPQSAPDYIIGPGDLLGISVWRDENLTRSLVVLPDGKIYFPLTGELVAGGKTVSQLKRELVARLAKYVTDAELTVEVKQSNSMIVYIIGRVNAPGKQLLFAATNVMQGLAMAGGLNPFAQKTGVKVFRQQGDKTEVFSFNYNDVSEGRHLETNIELKRGDVLLVP